MHAAAAAAAASGFIAQLHETSAIWRIVLNIGEANFLGFRVPNLRPRRT
jgi:hypothetical protein